MGFSLAGKARALAVMAALFFCAAAAVLGCAHHARNTTGSMRAAYLPLMEAALMLEDRVYGAVFHAGIFGATGDMASYSGLRVSFAGIRESVAKVAELAAAVPGERDVARELEFLDDFARRLDLVAEKQRTLIDAFGAERKKLDAAAENLGGILRDMRMKTAPPEVHAFALAVEEITAQLVAGGDAGAFKNAAAFAVKEKEFGALWREAREACRAADPESFPRIEASVAAYGAVMGLLRFTMEETERLAADREEILERLASLARGIVTLTGEYMAVAASQAEETLFTALLVGGSLLTAGVALGFYAFFMRRAEEFV